MVTIKSYSEVWDFFYIYKKRDRYDCLQKTCSVKITENLVRKYKKVCKSKLKAKKVF